MCPATISEYATLFAFVATMTGLIVLLMVIVVGKLYLLTEQTLAVTSLMLAGADRMTELTREVAELGRVVQACNIHRWGAAATTRTEEAV